MFRVTFMSMALLLMIDAFLISGDSPTFLVSIAQAQECGVKSDGKYHCGTNCGYKSDGKFHCGTNCGYKSDGKFHCVGEEE